MEECPFCRIVSGKIKSHVIYEDDSVCAFLDHAKDVDYHMLVIPKKHYTSILDCDPVLLAHLIQTVQKIADHCVTRLGFDGINLLSAANQAAGQSVPHFHLHLIPRKKCDGINAWPTFNGAALSLEEAAAFLTSETDSKVD
ncbi:HIT domain-containing protein [Enterococcus sp. PF-2]|jgi:histidine triad (HIT) family protein|uniref:HIT family protein n=1 Tax=Enterococcus TaxID=1350 RepID=UPI000C76F4A3|nr:MULTISPECIES: HIT domain-containing protein [unclassified Enterococcus]AUJ85958.1 HIT family protein [Enterococcus sp. CR-Ec1]MBF0014847.1 HIT domain-containing protein [Enterococcus casseliflavus]TPE06554.1 HIT domain-containing protein [Enterococcus sp. PF-3]TPE28169.1 HIT domain-containing protein [Enterococcus sp. PF-2]